MKKITNRNLVQSYILTMARYDFSVYEKRILYRIVELIQHMLAGHQLNKDYRTEKTLFGDTIVTMPLYLFLKNEADNNYEQIKKALTSLRNKTIEYEDDEIWLLTGIIEKPKIIKRSSFVTFELQPLIFDALLNFAKGFRKLELKTAMAFDSIYAMRFYELLAGKTEPIKYTVDTLKKTFCLVDKYKLTADFVRYVIEPAKKELDAKSPYSFTYKAYNHGRKIEGWIFYPVYQPQNRDPELERKELQQNAHLSMSLPREVRKYLMEQYSFTETEIKRNIDLFEAAAGQMPDFVGWLAGDVKARANRADNPKGYLINALKKENKREK